MVRCSISVVRMCPSYACSPWGCNAFKFLQVVYRSMAFFPGAMPVRFIPMFRSMYTLISILFSAAHSAIFFAESILSTRQENFVPGYFFISVIKRLSFGPIGWYANKTSGVLIMASISASAMVAHLNLLMPASIISWAASFVLCVFTCGRKLLTSPTIDIAVLMFCITLSL